VTPTSNTLADFPAETFTILAFCDAFGRSRPLDRAAVPSGLTVDALRRRLRCTACGPRSGSSTPPPAGFTTAACPRKLSDVPLL